MEPFQKAISCTLLLIILLSAGTGVVAYGVGYTNGLKAQAAEFNTSISRRDTIIRRLTDTNYRLFDTLYGDDHNDACTD